MHDVPLQEMLPEEPPIIRVIEGFFSEAYQRQMSGDSPLYNFNGMAGDAETIALNPKDNEHGEDNVRFFIGGGGLDFAGLSIQLGNDDIEIKYAICKITLPHDNSKPIEELAHEETQLSTVYFVSADGQVLHEHLAGLNPADAEALIKTIEDSELATALPDWAMAEE